MSCSCGETTLHIVANRQTFDGIGIAMWCDGAVTGCLGAGLRNVPVARPRTDASRVLEVRAARLFLGEVCLHSASDLGPLHKACRWAAARDGLPGTVRSRLKTLNSTRLGASKAV